MKSAWAMLSASALNQPARLLHGQSSSVTG
jgi:hypothetical protein